LKFEHALVIIEPAAMPKAAFLFGAGHVAKPTAHLCALTGFYVTVLDDRKEFANADNFPDSHETRVLDSFENAFDSLHVDKDSFIVIFTRGHLHDRTVLAQALKTEAGYIGMIGSRKKRDNIYKALLRIGYEQRDIDRVHSPIGLGIGAQSPEEIAVSIVAEMIQKRARMST
jgi:xanthine dehydrogenase accessory factor